MLAVMDNTTGMLLLLLYMRLDGSKTHARVLIAEFSSVFNTIHPLILADRLKERFGLELQFDQMDFKHPHWEISKSEGGQNCV